MTKEIEELCKKLKPILGEQIDRLWQTYMLEDAEGKKEIEETLQVLAAKYLAGTVDNPGILFPPPPYNLATGDYPVARVIYNNKTLHTFGLVEAELIQHCAIFGRSGAGKTNAALILIGNLLAHGKPFLMFDWKRNYRDLLANPDNEILLFTVGRDVSPFRFNPHPFLLPIQANILVSRLFHFGLQTTSW